MELTDDEIKAIKKFQGTGTPEEEWLKRPMYPSEWKLIFGEPPKEHKVREKSKWIGIDEFPHDDWECSCCGFIVDNIGQWIKNYNFCPRCGDKKEMQDDSQNL